MQTLKVMVIGTDKAGKTAFIDIISEINVVAASGRPSSHKPPPLPLSKMLAPDFGRVTVDEDLVIYLFGIPAHNHFEPMWRHNAEGMAGIVLLVDSTRPETLPDMCDALNTFLGYAPVPYVIAVTKQDLPDALSIESIRPQVQRSDSDKIIACNATNKDSVRDVLIELLLMILKDTEQNL